MIQVQPILSTDTVLVTTSNGSSDIHDCSNYVTQGRMGTRHDPSLTTINLKQSKFSSNCSQAYPSYYSSHDLASGGSSSALLTSNTDYSDSLLLGLPVDVDNGDAKNPVDIWCPGENKIIWTPGYNVVNEVKKKILV